MEISSILAYRAVNFLVEYFAAKFNSDSLRTLSGEMEPCADRPSWDAALPHTWRKLWGENVELTIEDAASVAVRFLEEEGDWGDDDGHLRVIAGLKQPVEDHQGEVWVAWKGALEKARCYSDPAAWSFESEDWHGFWIGQQPTLCLWITYLKASGIPAEGWHLFRAEAAAPGFKALFDFHSQLGEFGVFRNQVLAMHETLRGEAHFGSTESNALVDGTMDRFGHVFWAVTLRSPRSGEVWPELKFNIQEDQTRLWNVAAKIEDMLEWLNSKTT
jgi:hypothetical protein